METKNKIYRLLKNPFIIVGVCILMGIVGYFMYQKMQTPQIGAPIPTRIIPTATLQPVRSTMSLSPDSVTVNPNKQFKIEILIDAKNRVVNGVDSIIQYDPEMVRPLTITQSPDNTDFILLRKQIDDSVINITASKTAYTATPTAQISLVTITFKALKTGSTKLALQFIPGNTTKSTIIEADTNENILDYGTDAVITIE